MAGAPREERRVDKLTRMLVGVWLKAWREGLMRHECKDAHTAYRLRFAVYAVRKVLRKTPEGVSQEILDAMEGVALRLEGKVLVGYRKDQDDMYDGLEELAVREGEEVSEEALKGMERMRLLQESLDNKPKGKYD